MERIYLWNQWCGSAHWLWRCSHISKTWSCICMPHGGYWVSNNCQPVWEEGGSFVLLGSVVPVLSEIREWRWSSERMNVHHTQKYDRNPMLFGCLVHFASTRGHLAVGSPDMRAAEKWQNVNKSENTFMALLMKTACRLLESDLWKERQCWGETTEGFFNPHR